MLHETEIIRDQVTPKEITIDISYPEAAYRARMFNETVRGDDIRFQYCVSLVFKDGTSLFFKKAFVIKCDDWLFMYQRSNYQIFDFEKLLSYGQYKVVGIEVI